MRAIVRPELKRPEYETRKQIACDLGYGSSGRVVWRLVRVMMPTTASANSALYLHPSPPMKPRINLAGIVATVLLVLVRILNPFITVNTGEWGVVLTWAPTPARRWSRACTCASRSPSRSRRST